MMTTMDTVTETAAAERVQALIDITASLNMIFEEENIALEEHRPSDAAPLQAEKARLAAAYAQSIRAVAADRSGIAAVEEDLLMQLRTITTRFEARAARQHVLLHSTVNPGENFAKKPSEIGPDPENGE